MIDRILKKLFSSKEVYFVGSADALPPPLSKKEEEQLVLKYLNGDINARP